MPHMSATESKFYIESYLGNYRNLTMSLKCIPIPSLEDNPPLCIPDWSSAPAFGILALTRAFGALAHAYWHLASAERKLAS